MSSIIALVHAMTAVVVIMFYDVHIIKHNYKNSSHSMTEFLDGSVF